jgi:hypothetical protein
MIEGTRQFKGGDKKSDTQEAVATTPPESAKAPQISAPPASDAVNLERREWFNSLLPALGDGLVKILRVSNNLQQELHTALKEKTDSFALPPAESPEKEKPDR